MRNLYWRCLGGGVLALAGVCATALYAVHHPDSFVGQAVFSVTQFVAHVHPMTDCGQGGCPCCQAGHDATTSQDGPAEVCEPQGQAERRPFEYGVVGEPTPTSATTIPEDEPIPPAPMPVGDAGTLDVECPPSEHALAAPLTMPSCEDDTCEAGLERLPMPRVEGDDEEQEVEEP